MRSTLCKLLLLLVALPLGAASAQDKVIVTAENAKLHGQPALSALGTVLVKGATLTVLERKGDWITVYDGKKQGYVHSAFLTTIAPAPAPEAVVVAPAPVVQQGYPTAPGPQQRQPMVGYQPTQPVPMRTAGMQGFKDPSTSRLFSIVFIGGGQFYSGETMKGLVLAGLGYGSWVALPLFAVSQVDNCASNFNSGNYSYSYGDCGAGSIGTAAIAAYAVSLGTWIYGIMDADNAARRTNMKPVAEWQPAFKTDGKRTYLGMQYNIR